MKLFNKSDVQDILHRSSNYASLHLDLIKSNAQYSYNYACEISPRILTDIEDVISNDPKYAYLYAFNCLNHSRFELGEEAISKSSIYSYMYAFGCLKSKFELGEPAIANSAMMAYEYALNVLCGAFELGEPELAKDEFYTAKYTQNVLKSDFILNNVLICEFNDALEPFIFPQHN